MQVTNQGAVKQYIKIINNELLLSFSKITDLYAVLWWTELFLIYINERLLNCLTAVYLYFIWHFK